MVEKSIARAFLGLVVGFDYDDCGTIIFRRGTVTAVTDSTILIDFFGEPQAFPLEGVKKIRVLKNDGASA